MIAAGVYAALALLSAAIQCALAAGAPLGAWTLGGVYPTRLPGPQRAGAAVQSMIYLAMALVIAGHGGLLDWAPPRWAVWPVLAVTAIGALGALVTPARRERRLWAPVTLAMVLAAGVVALA